MGNQLPIISCFHHLLPSRPFKNVKLCGWLLLGLETCWRSKEICSTWGDRGWDVLVGRNIPKITIPEAGACWCYRIVTTKCWNSPNQRKLPASVCCLTSGGRTFPSLPPDQPKEFGRWRREKVWIWGLKIAKKNIWKKKSIIHKSIELNESRTRLNQHPRVSFLTQTCKKRLQQVVYEWDEIVLFHIVHTSIFSKPIMGISQAHWRKASYTLQHMILSTFWC